MKSPEVARLMAGYAKAHAGGAFSSPIAKDLNVSGWHEWRSGLNEDWAAVITRQGAPSHRRDWTGRSHTIPAGVSVCKFVAHAGTSPRASRVPAELNDCDFLFTYADDPLLSEQLKAWRRPRAFTRISASSEIITCWGPRGWPADITFPEDCRTAYLMSHQWLQRDALAEMRAELDSLDAWHDDYPYYSDGSWGAINLRGFNPADPLWGVKPAEMPRKWQQQHPGCLDMRCDWTTITDKLPTMRTVAASLFPDSDLERVRLMRMAAKPGGGHLARHSDVTDKAAGTRPGQIARFHIPIVTHPDITMTVWELDGTRIDQHLAAGEVWYLDQRKPHAVTNPSPVDRVHLVVDVVVDDRVLTVLRGPG